MRYGIYAMVEHINTLYAYYTFPRSSFYPLLRNESGWRLVISLLYPSRGQAVGRQTDNTGRPDSRSPSEREYMLYTYYLHPIPVSRQGSMDGGRIGQTTEETTQTTFRPISIRFTNTFVQVRAYMHESMRSQIDVRDRGN